MPSLVILKKYFLSVLFSALFCIQSIYAVNTPQNVLEPMQHIPPNAQKVFVGMYLMNLYSLNMYENTFYADFYVWFRWKGDLNPIEHFEFVNAVEKWAITQNIFEEDTIITLPDGYQYNGFRIEGRFYNPFTLHNYPLDKHILNIQLENNDYGTDSLVYLPDTAAAPSQIRNEVALAGWSIENISLQSRIHQYGSNFGRTDQPQQAFSNLAFELQIERPVKYFLLKLLLPLFIVIIAGLSAMLIYPTYIDARNALPIAALLTAVFLQQSYTASLPDVGYMVLMDKIYLVAYTVIVLSLIQIIITSNWVKDNTKAQIQKAKKFDRIALVILILLFEIGTIWLVTTV